MPSVLGYLKERLQKARASLTDRISAIFTGGRVDEAVMDDLLDTLIAADTGVKAAEELVEAVKESIRSGGDTQDALEAMKNTVRKIFEEDDPSLHEAATPPTVVMLVGVNGCGKTTTAGKLAHALKQQGKKVLLAAADTFRAAATEQLEIWARRSGAGIVKHQQGGDPAAVVYDAMEAAVHRRVDYVIIDTAGRLQTKTNLMEELAKLRRVIKKHVEDAPHETLLVLDATTGQNALSQAKLFNEATPLTGIVVAKYDSTAKGGILIAIRKETDVPVKFVGIGEQIEDLQPFVATEFAEALFSRTTGEAYEST